MLDETILEKRLVKLEQTVAALEQKFESEATSPHWLEKLIGSISDEEAFLEALEYGRTFRYSEHLVNDIQE